MSDRLLTLKAPPIVEAVLDIDCDMPPGLDIAGLETATRDALRDHYPKFRKQFMQALQVQAVPDQAPNVTTQQGIRALQILEKDEKQLVQIRVQGFSFNRLAPYSSLDEYLPEMERTWRIFLRLVMPIQVRLIRLRYINRIMIPLETGRVDLDKYLKLGPRLPDEDRLTLVGFLNQHTAEEIATGNRVNIVLTGQTPENDKLPLILDIDAFRLGECDPSDWKGIESTIQSLRHLKNTIFENSLTDQCLDLFQH
jgi:uncharacterized protein (TIGR04255 family)